MALRDIAQVAALEQVEKEVAEYFRGQDGSSGYYSAIQSKSS